MDRLESDWQGFESFNEEYIIPSKYIVQPHKQIAQQAKQQGQCPLLEKKITIKSKNKRKFSYFQINNIKKPINQSLIQKPTQIMSSLQQKSRINHSFGQKKSQGIPIFRQLAHPCIGKLIYKGNHFQTAEQYLARNKLEDYQPNNQGDLIFNSKFESGNLEQVVKVLGLIHSKIIIDTNTKGHRQWYYFTVLSPKTIKAKFIIHSFKKRLSLYQIGMKPYGKTINQSYDEWKPVGANVRYYKATIMSKLKDSKRTAEYYLSFEIELEKDVQLCLASCIPYSYSFLKQRITMYRQPNSKIRVDQSILCKSLTGMQVPLLTINQQASLNPNHRYIILNARTHPGESSASWVLDGLLNEITHSQIVQNILLQFNIIIKIVPMLNVEGVYIGNYRTGIMGVDFNRLFLSGSPDLFPEIDAVRKMIQQCKKRGTVDLFLDFHGHSILPGCFIYGPEPAFAPHSELKNLIKQLQKSKYFSRSNCVYGSDISKVETSRLYFQIQHGIYSLTLQNSLGLFNPHERRNRQKQFEAKDWQHFGKDIIDLIVNIYDEQNFNENIQINLSDEQIKVNSPDQEQFVWQKSKTDKGKIQNQLNKLNWLDLQQIDLVRSNITITASKQHSDIPSLNDSDNQSQNLSLVKQQYLIKAVKKKIEKNKSMIQPQLRTTSINMKQMVQQNDNRRLSSSSKGQCINKFKEYRFGFEDNTISDWYTRKRLLSVPKHLKNERKGQSYLIRKKNHRSVTEQQSLIQTIQATKRILTQQKQFIGKTSYDKFSKERLVNKQKMLFDLLARKQ